MLKYISQNGTKNEIDLLVFNYVIQRLKMMASSSSKILADLWEDHLLNTLLKW